MVIQTRLGIELRKALPGADNAALLVKIRESLKFIDTLPTNVQTVVRKCYASSVRVAFLMSLAVSIGAFFCSYFVKEKRMPK
jgi:hypothetical protein